MRIPTFIIGGAPKCGTTALWDYLHEHPEVSLASIKEPRFFSTASGNTDLSKNAYGPRLPGTFNNGFKWYENLFSTHAKVLALGEASTVYFGDETSPALIKKYIPEVRLIFLLREPVARLYSHYWQEFKLGWDLPPFDELYHTNHPRFQYYCQVSAYRTNLERYFVHFTKEQILVLLQEDLIAKPEQILSRVYSHIGVNNTFRPSNLGQRFNQQQTPRNRHVAKVLANLQARGVKVSMPKIVRKGLGGLRQWVTKMNSGDMQYAPLSEPIREELSVKFQQDVSYLRELLCRDLAQWGYKE